jgi:hypothetical protein
LRGGVSSQTAFGDDNQGAIDAQVRVINACMNENQVIEAFEGEGDYILSNALDAVRWLEGDGSVCSDGWAEMTAPPTLLSHADADRARGRGNLARLSGRTQYAWMGAAFGSPSFVFRAPAKDQNRRSKMKKMDTTTGMLVLFKFGREEHLTALRQQGLLHMQTMRYFADAERENPARGDRFEGTARIFQPTAIKMIISHPVIGSHEVDPRDLAGPVIFSYEREAEQNILCLFSLTAPTTTRAVLHEDHLRLGSHFVLFLNTREFLDRVHRELVRLDLSGTRGPVKYYDESSYSGEVGPFWKPKRFAYQQEYRIVVRPGQAPFRDLVIGDISDITSPVLPLSELDQIVDFSQEAAIAAGIR